MSTGNIAKGSSAVLYFVEEDAFGKPDLDYNSSEYTVAERAEKGALSVKLSTGASGLADGDWLALYTGNFAGIVQMVQVSGTPAVSQGVTTVTLDGSTPLSYTVRKDDKAREIDGFNPEKIRVISGMVTAGLGAEVGQIRSEALRASGGARVRPSARPGSVTAEGGSIVVEPGTKGFASLLRHAVGARVYYNNVSPLTGGANTKAVNDSDGASAGDTSITVDGGGVFAKGDRVLIDTGDDAELATVKTAVAAAGTTLELEQGLLRDHDDDTTIAKVTGVQPIELRKGSLPVSFTIYQWHEDIRSLYILTGVKISSIDLTGDNTDATVKCTFNTIAKAAQLLNKLPFSSSEVSDPASIPYSNLEIGLLKGGVRQVGINSIGLNLDNEIESDKEIGSPVISSAAEGVGLVTATFNYQLFTDENQKATLLETKGDYAIDLSYDAAGSEGQGIRFDFPQALLTGNVVPAIDTATGLKPDAALESGQHPVKKTELIVTVKTDEGRIE